MNFVRLSTGVACLLFVVGSSCGARAEESWQPLMGRAPSDANVLVMIHAEKIRGSGFAAATDWNSADSAPGGLRSILPRREIERVLFAARLNLADLSPRWEAGILQTKSDSTLDVFAAGIHGPHESLGTTPAVRLPFDAYLLKLSPGLFGILGPADRQHAAQWARSPAESKSLDSAYLQKIAGFPETVGTEIILGIDLADAVDLATVEKIMRESPALRAAKIDPVEAARIITSLEGMALGVRVLDRATGMIRLDFRSDPSALAAVMKPLLLERLTARGALIEDFKSWKLEMSGQTAFLGGDLTPLGLSLVLSIVEPELPADGPAPSSAAASQSSSPTVDVAQLSKTYFTKVRGLVTEVRFPSSDLKIVSAGAFGAWIDRQARRIDQLPILNVDPELLDYSQGVARSLRVTAAKQRGATISAAAYSTRRYRYDDGNQSYVSESQNQIQSRMETSAANLSHVDVMRMIDDETAAIRRRLTERYQIEF